MTVLANLTSLKSATAPGWTRILEIDSVGININ